MQNDTCVCPHRSRCRAPRSAPRAASQRARRATPPSSADARRRRAQVPFSPHEDDLQVALDAAGEPEASTDQANVGLQALCENMLTELKVLTATVSELKAKQDEQNEQIHALRADMITREDMRDLMFDVGKVREVFDEKDAIIVRGKTRENTLRDYVKGVEKKLKEEIAARKEEIAARKEVEKALEKSEEENRMYKAKLASTSARVGKAKAARTNGGGILMVREITSAPRSDRRWPCRCLIDSSRHPSPQPLDPPKVALKVKEKNK